MRVLRPLGWIALSFTLGLWAWSFSSNESLSLWQKEHRPGARLISGLLRSQGFEEVQDAKLAQKLYRSLPATLGETGELWWSAGEKGAVLAWMEDPQAPQPFRLFCHTPCLPEKPDWQKLGRGWSALEALFPRIDSLQDKLKKSAPRPRAAAEYRDRRELRF